MFLGIIGGMAACVYGGFSTLEDYIRSSIGFYSFSYALCVYKNFSFCIYTNFIPSFYGYYISGALEVGKASTVAFVWTSVVIILINYILTQMLLNPMIRVIELHKSFGDTKI